MTSARPRLSRVSAAAAIAFALAAAPAAAAGYLKLGDIKGETAAKGRGGEIHIESWSWGATNAGESASRDMSLKGSKIGENAADSRPGTAIGGGIASHAGDGNEDMAAGTSTGPGQVQELTVKKSTDKSSPKLLESAVKGKVFASPAPRGSMTTLVPAGTCRLGARYPSAELGAGGKVYTMTGVVVTSCSTGGSGGSDMLPMESISFNYDKIVWN